MRMISSFLFFLALLPVLGVMAHDGYKYYNNQADGLQLSSVQDVLLSYSVDALKKVEDMVPKNMLPFVFETIMPMNGLLFTILFAVCVGLTTGCFGPLNLFFPRAGGKRVYQVPGKSYKYGRKG